MVSVSAFVRWSIMVTLLLLVLLFSFLTLCPSSRFRLDPNFRLLINWHDREWWNKCFFSTICSFGERGREGLLFHIVILAGSPKKRFTPLGPCIRASVIPRADYAHNSHELESIPILEKDSPDFSANGIMSRVFSQILISYRSIESI